MQAGVGGRRSEDGRMDYIEGRFSKEKSSELMDDIRYRSLSLMPLHNAPVAEDRALRLGRAIDRQLEVENKCKISLTSHGYIRSSGQVREAKQDSKAVIMLLPSLPSCAGTIEENHHENPIASVSESACWKESVPLPARVRTA